MMAFCCKVFRRTLGGCNISLRSSLKSFVSYNRFMRLSKIVCTASPSYDTGLLSKRSFHLSSSTRRDYEETFQEALNNPEKFWAEAAEQIDWTKKWDRVLDQSNNPFTKWFVGGELNTCYNALDRHVEHGRGERVAIIHDSPVTNSITRVTYNELLEEVKTLAGALTAMGVQKGDRVLIYMPMIPEAIVVMLASARIGAIHSLVFGGFAAKELSVRIAHAEPKVVVSANCGIEPSKIVPYKPLLDAAIDRIQFKPEKCIIYNRPDFEPATLKPGRDLDWDDAMNMGRPSDPVPLEANEPLYILYTSGTTGMPKAVVRPCGGHAVALKWSMWNIYGVKPDDVWWAASDLGWVVGHSYIAYAPLLNGCTSVMYEGKPVGTPDPGAFFRVLKEHHVKSMFVAPTALRAVRAEDDEGTFATPYLPLNNLENVFLAGEHCDHETMAWVKRVMGTPALDNWWQTETGWAITASCPGMNMNLYPEPGTTGKPVPGWNVKVLRADGTEAEPNELGQIYVKLPLPPGSFSTLYKGDERFEETYFRKIPGYYDTMDAGLRSADGYISVLSRSDDVINVAGHRLSCGSLEEAIVSCHDVVEAAVIGVPDRLKGSVPLAMCVVKRVQTENDEGIKKQVIQQVREEIGPVAAFKLVIIVPKLPKTRSGKVPRNTLAALAAGKPFDIPPTIDDASVYGKIRKELQAIGLAHEQTR